MINIIGNIILSATAFAAQAAGIITSGLRLWLPFEKSEILGANLTEDYNFQYDGWISLGGTTIIGNTFTTTSANYGIYKSIVSNSKTYKLTIAGTTDSNGVQVRNTSNSALYYQNSATGSFSATVTFTATHNDIYIKTIGTGELTVTTLKIEEVTQISPNAFKHNEQLGDDLNAGYNFNIGWSTLDANVDYPLTYTSTPSDGGVYKNLVEVGKTYKLTIGVVTTSSNGIRVGNANDSVEYYSTSSTGNISATAIFTATQTNVYLKNKSAGQTTVFAFKIQELIKPSTNKNNATLYTGKALSFDGVNDYVDLGLQSMPNTSAATFAFWCNPTLTSSTGDKAVIRYGKSNVWFHDNNEIQIYSNVDAFPAQFTSLSDPSGKYQRFVVTISGTTTKLYIDGTLIGSETTPAISTTASASYIGQFNSDKFLPAKISDVQLYDVAWTQADVTYDYNKPNHLVTDNPSTSIALSNLKGYWALSEGDGAIAYDSSGEGNDGTINGATYVDKQPTILQLGMMDWSKGSNLITYSEDFSNSGWGNGSNATVTAGFTSPTGLSTAYRMNASADNGHIRFTSPTIDPSNLVSVSIFAKKGTTTKLKIVEQNYLGTQTTFDLNSGSIDAGGNTTSSSIESYGNGWYRCSVTQAYSSGQTSAVWAFMAPTAGNLFLWGAQIEEASSPSAYRRTNGSTVINATLISDPNDPSKDVLDNTVRLREHSLNLDAIGYAQVNPDSSLDIANYSIDGWVYNTNNSIDWEAIITKHTQSNFEVYIRNARFYYFNNSGDGEKYLGDAPLNTWTYFCITESGGTLKSYINNNSTPFFNGTVTQRFNTSGNLYIGSHQSGNYSNALIDDIRVYDRALSADEILNNYTVGLPEHKLGSSFSDDFSSDYGN